MLNIVNSVENARMSDINIYFGKLLCHGKLEDIALSFSPKTKKLKLYYHKDNTIDIDFVKHQTKKEREIYIITRLFLLYKHSSNVIDDIKIINSYNQKIPDSYILVLECDYIDKLELITLLVRMNKEEPHTSEYTSDKDILIELFNINDDDNNVSYPKDLAVFDSLHNKISDNDFLQFYFNMSNYVVNIYYDYKYSCKYNTTFNGYTLNVITAVSEVAVNVITLCENTSGALKTVDLYHGIIACYLATLNPDDFTEFDKRLFQLLIDNSREIDEHIDSVFSYNIIAESFYNLLQSNNINFSTLIDIIYHSQNDIIETLNKLNVKEMGNCISLKMHLFLIYMFYYLIKDVKSLKTDNKSLFKIIK